MKTDGTNIKRTILTDLIPWILTMLSGIAIGALFTLMFVERIL
jgi:hypothetical protein